MSQKGFVKSLFWVLLACLVAALIALVGEMLCPTAEAEGDQVGFLNIVSVTFHPDHFCPGEAGEIDVYLRAQPGLVREETILRVTLLDGLEVTRVIPATEEESHQWISFTAPSTVGYFCVEVRSSRPSDGLGDCVPAWSYVTSCSSVTMTGECVRGCTDGCINLSASGFIVEEQRWLSLSGTGISGELVFLYESGSPNLSVFLDGRYPLIPIRGDYQRVFLAEGTYKLRVWPGNYESGPDFTHLLIEAECALECDWPTETPTATPTVTNTRPPRKTATATATASPTATSTNTRPPRKTSTLSPTMTPSTLVYLPLVVKDYFLPLR